MVVAPALGAKSEFGREKRRDLDSIASTANGACPSAAFVTGRVAHPDAANQDVGKVRLRVRQRCCARPSQPRWWPRASLVREVRISIVWADVVVIVVVLVASVAAR